MSALPYPTKHRLRLADAIAANQVKHYHWINPWTCDTARDAAVTSRVAELVAAGLAVIPDPPDELPESLVRLTPEGMAWVTRARTADVKITAGGPVSTSPETGPGEPPWCSSCGVRHPLWLHGKSTKDEEHTEGGAA